MAVVDVVHRRILRLRKPRPAAWMRTQPNAGNDEAAAGCGFVIALH